MPLPREPFAAVLFDNDGTLVDSTAAAVRAWTTWAGEYDASFHSLSGVHGLPARDIVRQVAPHADPSEALARIVHLEEQDTEGVVALPGAKDALEACENRCALVTSATHDLALARLAVAQLPTPPVVVSAEDITHGKPDPEPFLLAARQLGVDPERCLVVEDAPAGLAAARAGGMASLAVRTTAGDGPLDADLVVDDLSAVRFVATADGITVPPAGS